MYDFHDLSPLDFEELIRDLLQAEEKIRLESFGPGKDQGIDSRYSKDATNIVVQAKHYLRSGRAALIKAMKAENAKVAKLKPTRYIIATSVSLTSQNKQKIIDAMPSAPLQTGDILGQEELNNLLGRHPEVEKKHFKLWLSSATVLERFLLSGIYNRSETELELIKAMVPRFVQNESVTDAEKILSNASTLIISGHPGVGKTTLARILIWLHAAQGWSIFVIDDLDQAFEIASPAEKRLIFFDDFLGQVRLSSDHVRGIDRRLPPFLDRVRHNPNLRFILTTREYILSQAELLAQRLASEKMNAHRYVLNVGDYTREVKAKILYNHLYFSDLGEEKVQELAADDFYLKIIDHPNYNPRLIELLTSEKYSALAGENLRSEIQRILNNPNELWEAPYREHISEHGRALMIAMLMFSGSADMDALKLAFGQVSMAFNSPISKADLLPSFRRALKELEGSVLSINKARISFSNPGVKDFLQAVVLSDDLLPSLVEHTSTVEAMSEWWAIFFDRQPKPTPIPSDRAEWVTGMENIECNSGIDALRHIELALDMHDHFGGAEFIRIAKASSAVLNEQGVGQNDVRITASALENLAVRVMDREDGEFFKEIFTDAALGILFNEGPFLHFDDIETLDYALFTFGSSELKANQAVFAALDSLIPDLDKEMADFLSVEELDEFENRLRALMVKRTYVGKSPDFDLRYKRDRLEEDEVNREAKSGYEDYASRLRASKAQSDDLIRSMFSDLTRLYSK